MMRTGVVTTMTITMKTTRMVKATTMRMMKTMGTTPGMERGWWRGQRRTVYGPIHLDDQDEDCDIDSSRGSSLDSHLHQSRNVDHAHDVGICSRHNPHWHSAYQHTLNGSTITAVYFSVYNVGSCHQHSLRRHWQ